LTLTDFGAKLTIMIEEKKILSQIEQLPENLKTEVLHYIEFLQEKHAKQTNPATNKKRKAGSAKGKYKPASDFDEPLEDFKEYM
jgi:hypothetical protein